MNLQGKTVVLGITGGIAAYKMPNVAHALVKLGADVHVLMTKNATEFITPLVFETLTNRRCIVDTFDRNFQYDVAHISLANAADLLLIWLLRFYAMLFAYICRRVFAVGLWSACISILPFVSRR